MRGWWIAAALCAAACNDGDGDAGPPYGLTQRQVVQGLTFPTGFPEPRPVTAVDAFPSLNFASPVVVTHSGDGTDRLFVAELGGRIRVFDNDEATASSTLFLDISPVVVTGSERGLLGLAFDPDYGTNGYFYVYYSAVATVGGQDGGSERRGRGE